MEGVGECDVERNKENEGYGKVGDMGAGGIREVLDWRAGRGHRVRYCLASQTLGARLGLPCLDLLIHVNTFVR